tara:strand:+ start:1739 stop:3076 length:1338 start_codon:yes stop_codon:yes gene_type:complete
MAQTIQLKRGTGSSVPSSLSEGELAINLDSGKLFYGSGSSVLSSYTFTDITASGAISASGTVTGLTGSFNQLSVTSTGDTASPPLDGHLFRVTDTSNNNPDIEHFFVENDNLTYGMRWHYDGGDNDFSLYRHNNDAAGTPVIKFNRTDNAVTVYGSINGVSTLGGQTDAVLNISADSDIIYTADNDGDEVGQHIFKDRTATLLTVDETGADFSSNITASGNIIVGGGYLNGPTDNNFYITSDRSMVFDIDTDNDETGKSWSFRNGGVTGQVKASISEDGDFQCDRHITASGNISASGDIIASTLTGKFKHRDLQLGRQTNNLNDNANGDIIYWDVSQGTTQGNIYSLCDGTWTLASNAGSVSTGSLAIAMGDDAQVGMCVRGLVYMAASYSTTAKGSPVYLSTTTGRLTNAVSTTSGKINRIVGYHMSGSQTIYFNPDNTWIEVS